MKTKISLVIAASIVIILFCIALGSVNIPVMNIIRIIMNTLFGVSLPDHITSASVAIVWNLRLPRVLLAFLAGCALSVSGAVMQSVLRNPLASSFTLGVSSGASLGASLFIFIGVSLPVLAMLTLPILGFVFGLGTILLVMAIAAKMDSRMENQTIILTGMVLSLLVNAITTLMFTFFREDTHRMIFWQMGSFSMKDWYTIFILVPIVATGLFIISRFNMEMDVKPSVWRIPLLHVCIGSDTKRIQSYVRQIHSNCSDYACYSLEAVSLEHAYFACRNENNTQ